MWIFLNVPMIVVVFYFLGKHQSYKILLFRMSRNLNSADLFRLLIIKDALKNEFHTYIKILDYSDHIYSFGSGYGILVILHKDKTSLYKT